MTRVRERTSTYTGWRIENFGAHVSNDRTIISKFEHCEDVVAAGDNWPLDVSRTYRDGGNIVGIGSSLGYTWYDYPCAYVEDSYLTSHLAISAPSNDSIASQIAARTQPYRPSMVSLEYLEDLTNIGALLKDKFGHSLSGLAKVYPASKWPKLKLAAKLFILEQFVVLPLISDIKTLMNFQRLVDSRVKEIDRLYGSRGLRRTKHLWKSSAIATILNQTIQSQGVLLHCDVHKITEMSKSAHIRWYANFPIKPADADIRTRLEHEIFGWDLNPYTIYQIIPWSWLIDYFTNLGEIALAAKNMFEVTHSPITVTTVTRTIGSTTNHDSVTNSGNTVSCSPISTESVSISRDYATNSLIARQEILSVSQTSILGSLAVLRL